VLGTDNLKNDALAYIDYVASRCWNARQPATDVADDERRAAIEAWEELERLVAALLAGATLGRNLDGVALINGRPGASGLSDGQKALLVAATAFHAQRVKLDETIILVDEPETHLHPSAQIEFIDRLIRATPNGQVWIATHSIHILSHVDPSSLWFVENGSVTWAGKNPEIVISRLVGDEERVGRLERFLQLPAIFAMKRFVAECLSVPTVVSTGADDPQSTQIRDIILDVAKSSKLRVLDYGAGKGRILAALREGTDDLTAKIEYRAYEIDEVVRTECVGAVAEAYGVAPTEAADWVYGDETSLRSRLNPGSVDVIVMCNVLHEVEPRKWLSLFKGILRDCLREGGHILIVEDMHIPHGEHAHAHGFILLDTEQLQELFRVDRENRQQFSSHGTHRLKAHLVRADVLGNVSVDTVRRALERRRASARVEIQRIRTQEPSFANGRLLGLYAMLHANASLALDEP
jgi:SAM-dependent methyltransferase